MKLVELKQVGFGARGGRTLAQGINLTVNPGEVLMITGANGAGKSTLLKVLLGEHPADGEIHLAIAPEKIAYLPQLQNVSFHLPLSLGDILRISQGGKVDSEQVRGMGLLDPSQFSLLWNTASGGERKRTLLTRALLKEPQLLILDEPLNHLDQQSRDQVCTVIADFMASDGKRALVMVSHDLPELQGVAKKRCFHLEGGTGRYV